MLCMFIEDLDDLLDLIGRSNNISNKVRLVLFKFMGVGLYV